MKEKFREHFGGGNAASKTNIAIGVGIIVFLVIAGVLLSRDISKADFGKKKGTEQLLQNTQPDVGNQNLAGEIRHLRDEMRAIQSSKQSSQLNEEQLNALLERKIAEKIGNAQVGSTPTGNPFETQGQNPAGQNAPLLGMNEDSTAGQSANAASAASGQVVSQDPAGKRQGLRRMKDDSAAKGGKADDNQTFLPPGAVLSYYLLTGINAPTNLTADDKNPPVALLTIKGDAILPNGFSAHLEDCFVTAAVFGQYMDSRAVGRTNKISCIRDDGKAVEATLTGQINGEDGKAGWRGRTVSKTGKVLAGLARVGALQAGSETLTGVANGIKINVGSSSSDSDTRTQINLGGTAGQSIAKNMGSGFEKMANIYEKYGEQAIPVIEVEPGRTGEIVLTEGLTLEFSKEIK